MKRRDMTEREFVNACERRGFRLKRGFGYVDIGHNYSMPVGNYPSLREALKAFIAKREELDRKTHLQFAAKSE